MIYMYKDKYLKYKNKYFKLKNNMKGGLHLNSISVTNPVLLGDQNYQTELIKELEYKSLLTIKSNNEVVLKMEIYEICNNKTFGILLNVINQDLFIHLFVYILNKLEYIIDKTKTIKTSDKLDTILIENESIIFLKNADDFKTISTFDFDTGCTNFIKSRHITDDKKYSINLLWISRLKSMNNCILFKDKIVYSMLGVPYTKENEYGEQIDKHLNMGILEFDYDDIHFNLNNYTYTKKDSSQPNKIYVDNFLQNLKNWSLLNPGAIVNLWYDSKLIEINTLIETILLFDHFNNENQNVMGIHIRDIGKLNILKRMTNEVAISTYKEHPLYLQFSDNFEDEEMVRNMLEKVISEIPDEYKNFLNPFDKFKMGKYYKKATEEEKKIIEDTPELYLPIYFRVDIAKLLILFDELEVNDYCFITDIDIMPHNKEFIFKDRPIDFIGLISASLHGDPENGLSLIGSKYNSIRKYIMQEIYDIVIKPVIIQIPSYINNKNNTPIGKQSDIKYIDITKLNYSINNMNQIVYVPYRYYFLYNTYAKKLFSNYDKIIGDDKMLIYKEIPELLRKKLEDKDYNDIQHIGRIELKDITKPSRF